MRSVVMIMCNYSFPQLMICLYDNPDVPKFPYTIDIYRIHVSLIACSSSPLISTNVRTAKAEKRFIEKHNRNNQTLCDKDQNQSCNESPIPLIKQLSPAEERALQAEKRASWRKARSGQLNHNILYGVHGWVGRLRGNKD